jgi:hypothetical protein
VAAYDLPFSSPIQMADASRWGGGPHTGGHQAAGGWTEEFGNDFGCDLGTQVYAAFDCKVLGQGWYPNLLNSVSADGKKYGQQMIVANDDGRNSGRVEAYYTHINQLEQNITPGATLKRGDPIGKVRSAPGIGIHLHFAMHAKAGDAWKGVVLPTTFIEWAKSLDAHTIRFTDDGKQIPDPPPAATAPPAAPQQSTDAVQTPLMVPVSAADQALDSEQTAAGSPDWACPSGDVISRGQPTPAPADGVLALSRMAQDPIARDQLLRLQRAIGNRATSASIRNSTASVAASALPAQSVEGRPGRARADEEPRSLRR